MHLADYLRTTFRDGITYRDAAHLCLAMYCVDNTLPTGVVDDKLSMEVIAEAFADLAQHGLIKEFVSYESVPFGANYHSIDDKGHWVEVQASVLKKGMKCEVERVERLKKSMLAKTQGQA
jgi:hypothetical protein